MTRWQKFYLEDARVTTAAPSYFSMRAANLFQQYRKRKILDLGCGVGRDSFALAGQSIRVIGSDLARSGLDIAQKECRRSHIRPVNFLQSDALYLPFGAHAFEGVYCFGLLHEFSHPSGWLDISQVMSEINRVLEPGGVLLLAVLAGDPLAGLPHVLLFSEEMFDRAAQSFHMIEIRLVDDTGCTGRGDYRTWQGVFRKSV